MTGSALDFSDWCLYSFTDYEIMGFQLDSICCSTGSDDGPTRILYEKIKKQAEGNEFV